MIKQRLEPNYRRDEVAAALRARITAGEWAPGALMPSVRELAAEYNCSPTDAHAALRILRSQGLVVIHDRRGATVASPLPSVVGPLEQLELSRAGSLFRPSEVPELLRVQLVADAPPEACDAFGLPADAELGLREYRVRTGEKIVTYGASYIHPDVWHAVPELREHESIPDGIIGAVARVLGRPTATIPPPRRKADFATDEEAEQLGVPQDAPVLVEVIECLDADGTLVEWNQSVHPHKYWVGQ